MSFMDNLAACQARVARAEQCAELLEASVDAYFASSSCIKLRGRFDAAAQEFVFEAWLTEALPLEWSLLLSDIIHQLRAACDNIVYALIVHRGAVPTYKASFPAMFATKAQYDGWRNPKKGPDPLGGLTPADIELIEQFQPWHPNTTYSRYLRYLQWMSNEDKHRLPHVVNVFVTSWGNRTTGELALYGFPFFLVEQADGTPSILTAPDLPAESLFPPNSDVGSIETPQYRNEPLATTPVEVVRVPIVAQGPNPDLQFFAPRTRFVYTTEGFDERSPFAPIFWIREAVKEIVSTLGRQFA